MTDALVLIAGTDPLEDHGGHQTYVRAHARAAIRAGFRPHLFCVSPERGRQATDLGTVHRVRSPWRRPPPRRGYRQWLAWLHVPLLAAAVERFIRARPQPYLLHAFGHWGAAAVRVARRAAADRPPVIPLVSAYTTLEHEFAARLRGTTPHHGRAARARGLIDLLAVRGAVTRHEREACTGARLVLVNYASVGRLLASAFGPGLAIRRVPYASEAAFVHATGPDDEGPAEVAELEPRGAPLIVAVSRHDPRKGVDVLLHALARLRADGVEFRACLVGGFDLLDAHRRLAARLGLGRETLLTGYVADPYPYLCRADVFALPSLQEASGSLSLLEALQAGAAVVASDVDGIPEDVTDGTSALLVPPGNPACLARALHRLVEDPGLRGRLARAGRATYEARFAADGLTAALRAVYRDLGFDGDRAG